MLGFDLSVGETFWIALGQIILVNIVLSGDNAVVIAMACRNLPERLRRRAVLAGSAGAVVLRLVFSFFITFLMRLPFIKIFGGMLLLWIGVKLLLPEAEIADDSEEATSGLWSAVRTIIVADAVMSLDNVVAIAAAAHGHFMLIAIGLIVSVPLIIYGSTLVTKALVRFPMLVVIGSGLLGWIAGKISFTDPAIHGWIEGLPAWAETAAAAAGALMVVPLGKYLAYRKNRQPVLTDSAANQP
jgi:YjbE family integral membrane protein